MSSLSKWTRRGLIAVTVVVALVLLIVAAAHTPVARDRALDWVRARLERDLGLIVEADQLRYNVLTRSVSLENVRLSVAGDRPFLEARAIHVALTRSLLRGNLEVDRLSLEEPHVLIVRHPNGGTNLPTTQSKSDSSPSPIHLGLVAIASLGVEVEDESAGSRVAVGPIDLTIDTRAGISRAGNFGPSPVAVTLGSPNDQGAPQTLTGQVFGRLSFDGSKLVVEALRLDAAEGRIGVDGVIDLMADPIRIDAQSRLELDLARANRFAGPTLASLSGSATADVTIRGPIADPAVRAVISGQSLRFQSSPAVTLSAEASYTSGRIEIPHLTARSDLGDADASGSLALNESAGPSRLSVQMARADIDSVLAAAGIKSAIKAGSSASGRIDVDLDGPVSAPSPELWQRVKAEGSIAFAPTGAGLSIQGQAALNLQGGHWTLRHEIRSVVASTTLAGAVSGDAPDLESTDLHRLSGRTRLQISDVRALLPILQQAGLTIPAQFEDVHGEIDAQIVPRGTLQAPSADATIAGRSIQIPDLARNGQLDSAIAIDKRAITARSLTAQLDSVRLSGSGEYMWNGQIASRFTAAADDVSALAKLLELSEDSLAGSINVDGSVRGTVQSLDGRAELTARNLTAFDVPVGALKAGLQLNGDRVTIDATAPDLHAHVRGGVGIRAPFPFQADADLERTPLAPLVAAMPDRDVAIDGTISAGLRATGNGNRATEATATVDLRSLDLKVGDVPLALASPSRLSIAPGAVAVDSLRLRVGKETEARLEGALALNERRNGIDVRVNGSLSDLLDLAELAGSDEPLVSPASDGQVVLNLHVGGSLMAPEPAGTLTLQAGALHYQDFPPLTNVKLAARVDRAQIALESLEAGWQGAALSATGAIPLRMLVPQAKPGATGISAWGSNWLATLPAEPRRATLTARATDITARTIEPFVDPAQLQKIGANVNASVSAEADGFALENVRASVVLDRAELLLAGVPLVQSTPTRIRLEQGQARIEELRWNAQGNELRVSGGAGLVEPNRTIDLVVDGAVDLRMLGAFASDIAPGGIAWPAITVKGPLASPEIVGGFSIDAGELRLETPGLSASDFSGTVYIDATRRTLISLSGLVNGGPATIDGTLTLDDFTSPRGRVTLTAQNVTLEYPEGFQTESNANLALTLGASSSTLTGRVDILSGVYREPIVISRTVLAGLGQSGTATVGTAPTFLSNLRLDITAATSDDLRIDNNYGRLDVAANLVVTGSADHPGLLGRLEAEPDGEVFLAGNTYRIQTLTIDFANPRTIAPEVTFLGETHVGNVAMEVALQCPASGPCERDIRSLTTGKTNEQAEALLLGTGDPDLAGAQLARLLSGEVLGIVGRSAGLDTLRLEQGGSTERSDLFDDPTLVAGDVDPVSRVTIGKRLGDRVELAYSQDLSQNGFVMTTTYFAPKGLSFRALLLDNQNRSYEFRHEPRFGGRDRPRRKVPPGAIVRGVTFSGTPGFPEDQLRGLLQLTDGDRFDFSRWQQDRERLRRFYHDNGFYEARVRGRRVVPAEDEHSEPTTATTDTEPGSVTLDYSIERGPATQLDVSGMTLPAEVRSRIVARWASAVFDGFLERDAALIVKEHLYGQQHLQAQVTATVERRQETANVHITVDPGPVVTPRLEFEGNASIPTARLLETVNAVGPLAAWLDPAAVSRTLEKLYQENGLLSATVEVRPPEIAGNESIVRVVVREGGAWQIGRVTVGGAEVLSSAASFEGPGLSTGERYDPAAIAERVAAFEQRFRDEGFLDVRGVSETVLDREERRADIHVLVEPGPRSVLASVEIDGADADDPTILRSLNLTVGKPVGAASVSTARRRLYETGVYRSVEISLQPVSGTPSPDGTEANRQVVAQVRVEERPRYSFRYGIAVNSDLISPEERDTRLGFAADLENRNVFGSGMTAGLSLRLRRDQEVARVFVGANRFFGLPLRSNVFLSRGREDVVSTAESQTVSDITDISFEQVFRLRRFVDLRYGYGFGQNRTTFTSTQDPTSDFELSVRAARLQTSALVDRRSDPFDPVRGSFSSASLEISRPGLGSDISFVKSFLQHYQFIALPRSLVLASSARVGLARTFRDEDLIPSERFLAGGATSVRGYHEDDLGPRSIFGDAAGGSAMLIANTELRFPVYRWVRGVGFVDLGNVYPTVGDILQTAVQVGTGAGIRVNSPVGLLRFDLGFAVNPRPFDPSWTVHFGLGHAF